MLENTQLENPDDLFGSREFRRRQGDVSTMTQHRREKSGILPPPDLRINGRKYWREGTYAKWLKDKLKTEAAHRGEKG